VRAFIDARSAKEIVFVRGATEATIRASLAFCNTREEVDQLVEAVHYAREVLT